MLHVVRAPRRRRRPGSAETARCAATLVTPTLCLALALALLAAAAGAAAAAQVPASVAVAAPAAPTAATAPAALAPAASAPGASAAPGASGIDLSWLDTTVQPCDDFYAYACGSWIAGHPPPPDQGEWSPSRELAGRVAAQLRQILERDAQAAAAGESGASSGGGRGGGRGASGGSGGAGSGAGGDDAGAGGDQVLASEQERVIEEQTRLNSEYPLRIDEQADRAAAEQRVAAEQERLAAVRRAQQPPPRDPALAGRRLGDDYASCMDEAGIEQRGLQPLALRLERLGGLRSLGDLPALLAELHRAGVPALFQVSVEPDAARGGAGIAMLAAAQPGLPSLVESASPGGATAAARGRYADDLTHVFVLLGDSPARAAEESAAVRGLESRLAAVPAAAGVGAAAAAGGGAADSGAYGAGWPRVAPAKVDRLRRADLAGLTPGFDWGAYFGALGAPPVEAALVLDAAYFRRLPAALAAVGVDGARSYLRWQLVRSAADLLPAAFAAAAFDVYGGSVAGERQMPPRWRRCVESTGVDLDAELTRAWADQALAAGARQSVGALLNSLRRALEGDITTLPWLSASGKRDTLLRVRSLSATVGAPPGDRDSAGLRIVRGDALGNRQRAAAFHLANQLAQIGRPAAAGSGWELPPGAVEPAYDPLRNSLAVPAGLALAPWFAPQGDTAVRFGAVGGSIGTALAASLAGAARPPGATFAPAGIAADRADSADSSGAAEASGADAGGLGSGRSLGAAVSGLAGDSGSEPTGGGLLQLHGQDEGWTAADIAELERRSACFAGQYVALLGEGARGAGDGRMGGGAAVTQAGIVATAGVRLAYRSYRTETAGRPATSLGGLSADQRFFLAFAQSQCTSAPQGRPAASTGSPESAGAALAPRWRVDGALIDLPEFARAWSCVAGSPMAPKEVCRLW